MFVNTCSITIGDEAGLTDKLYSFSSKQQYLVSYSDSPTRGWRIGGCPCQTRLHVRAHGDLFSQLKHMSEGHSIEKLRIYSTSIVGFPPRVSILQYRAHCKIYIYDLYILITVILLSFLPPADKLVEHLKCSYNNKSQYDTSICNASLLLCIVTEPE